MDKQKNTSTLMAYSTGLLQGTAYSRLHMHLTRALLPFNLSIPEWKLLGQVYEQNNLRLSDLAELLSYDPPMVTKLVKQLEKKKLILRQQDLHDERVKIISITKAGSEIVINAEPEVKKTMAKILTGITIEELTTYLKVLTAIVKNTEA